MYVYAKWEGVRVAVAVLVMISAEMLTMNTH